MPQHLQSKHQEFISKNKNVIESVILSCRKRLERYPKTTAEELFTALNKEFSDVYYEDKSHWIAYFKKNIPSILREIMEKERLDSLQLEQQDLVLRDELQNNQMMNEPESNEKEVLPQSEHRNSHLSHLPGDIHIEKSLPAGDIDTDEEPTEFTIVMPPRELEIEQAKTNLTHPELDLRSEPVSRKMLDQKRNDNFPFGKGMMK